MKKSYFCDRFLMIFFYFMQHFLIFILVLSLFLLCFAAKIRPKHPGEIILPGTYVPGYNMSSPMQDWGKLLRDLSFVSNKFETPFKDILPTDKTTPLSQINLQQPLGLESTH